MLKCKIFILLLLLFNSMGILATSFLARIQRHSHSLILTAEADGKVIPSILERPELEKIITSMVPGEEAFIDGDLIYHSLGIEGGAHRPYFLIKSIRPISLHRLSDATVEINGPTIFPQLEKSYIPPSLSVSTELASAMILSSSLLLLHSLAYDPNQPDIKQQIDGSSILFAGLLASGVFIYKEVKSKIHE